MSSLIPIYARDTTAAKLLDMSTSQIRNLTIEHDLNYEEVCAVVRTSTKRGKAPALYRNPDKPRQTWSGKGEAPDWFKNHPDPESLRIPGA